MDGRHTGGPAVQPTSLGGQDAADSPFLRRRNLPPALLNLLAAPPRACRNLFSGLFIGRPVRRPRVDEAAVMKRF